MTRRGVTSTSGGTAARRAARTGSAAPPRPANDAAGPSSDTTPAAPPSSAEPVPAPDSPSRRALVEERDFLLGSLRDLEVEHDAGDVDDDDYRSLKDDYTARAAEVLRLLDRPAGRDGRAGRTSPPSRSRARLVAIAAGVVLGAVLAGVLVAQAAGRRTGADSVSGDANQSSRDLLQKAHDLDASGELLEAVKAYDAVLQQQPANAEALTYKGWMLYRASKSGQADAATLAELRSRAQASFDEAVKADPGYGDVRIFRAVVLRDAGRPVEALAELDRVPPGQIPPFMQPLVDQLRGSAQTAATGPPGSAARTSPDG